MIAAELMSRYFELLDEYPVPAAELVEDLAAVVRSGQIEILISKLPGDGDANRRSLLAFRDAYQRDPERMEAQWAKLASELRAEYSHTAKRKLDTLTKLTLIGAVERNQAEVLNLQVDSNGQLTEWGVADDLVSLIPGATRRAGLLLEWSVTHASSEQADRFLSESATCFMYGLYASCAVMCRSLLEEIIERKLPRKLMEAELPDPKKRTLGALLYVARRRRPPEIGAEVLPFAEEVNKLGSLAAHQRILEESEALNCIRKARSAMLLLLS